VTAVSTQKKNDADRIQSIELGGATTRIESGDPE
jgi:hypothetical protein